MFKCDCCGLCCMHIDESREGLDLNRGDGVCRNFDEETHMCKIYVNRPLICNVDAFFDEYLHDVMSREDFYKINYEACEKIKERYGVN